MERVSIYTSIISCNKGSGSDRGGSTNSSSKK